MRALAGRVLCVALGDLADPLDLNAGVLRQAVPADGLAEHDPSVRRVAS